MDTANNNHAAAKKPRRKHHFTRKKAEPRRYSPVLESRQHLRDMAHRVVAILDEYGLHPLSFAEMVYPHNPSFTPPCHIHVTDVDMDILTSSQQKGNLNTQELDNVRMIKKDICGICPFAAECLAISMTSPQLAKDSKITRTLPGTEAFPLVMSEYMIFGGLTPQERKIVFDDVCDILEARQKRGVLVNGG